MKRNTLKSTSIFRRLLILSSSLLTATAVAQTTRTWVGTDGDMSSAANWNLPGVPSTTAGDTMLFDGSSSFNDITFPGATFAGSAQNGLGGLTISSTQTAALTINNSGAESVVFRIRPDANFTIQADAGAFSFGTGGSMFFLNPASSGTSTFVNNSSNLATIGDRVQINASGGAQAGGSRVVFDGNGDWLISGVATPSVTRGLIKNGSGTLTLAGDNAHPSTTTVNAGTLALAHVNALKSSTLDTGAIGGQQVTFALASPDSYNLGGLAGSDELSFGANSLNIGANNASTTFAGVLTGSGNITKEGTGTLYLSNLNNNVASITLNSGTLQYASADSPRRTSLSNSTLYLAGGRLQMASGEGNTPARATPNTIVLTGGQVEMNVDWAAKDQWFTGTISGTGSMRITGSGSNVTRGVGLSGDNSFSGGVTLDSNRSGARLGHHNGLGTGTLTVAGVTENREEGLGAYATLSAPVPNNIVINSGRILNIGGGGFNMELSGAISGAGNLNTQSAGRTYTLSGDNSYSGSTTIAAGTLQIGNGGATGTLGSGAVTNNGALIFNRSNDLIVGNAISGTGTLTKTGAGTLTLTNANTYTGSTTISAGTLQVGANSVSTSAGPLGSTATNGVNLGNAAGAVLDVNGYDVYVRSVTGGGALGGNVTLGTGGVLRITDPAFSTTFSGVISGAGDVSMTGSSGLNFAGVNTYTGTTTINGNVTMGLNHVNALGTTPGVNGTSQIIFNNSGQLRPRIDGVVIHAPITVNASSTAQIQAPDNNPGAGNVSMLTLNGAIGGNGNVSFRTLNNGSTSLNTVFLGAASDYEGSTLLAAGAGVNSQIIVKLGIANALPTTTTATIDGGDGTGSTVAEINLNGNSQTLAGLTNTARNGRLQRVVNSNLSSASTLTINNSADFTFSGNLGSNAADGSVSATAMGGGAADGNNFSLVKSGAGTFTLAGSNSYSGGTTVDEGTLLINGLHVGGGLIVVNPEGTLGGTGTVEDVLVENGGTLAPGASAGTFSVANLTLSPSARLDFELGAPNQGSFPSDSDFVFVQNALTLSGNLYISTLPSFGTPEFGDSWVLFEYLPGNLTNFGLSIASAPAGRVYHIDTTSFDGQVLLVAGVIPEPSSFILLSAGILVLLRVRHLRILKP